MGGKASKGHSGMGAVLLLEALSLARAAPPAQAEESGEAVRAQCKVSKTIQPGQSKVKAGRVRRESGNFAARVMKMGLGSRRGSKQRAGQGLELESRPS